jgi:hypothetical protein
MIPSPYFELLALISETGLGLLPAVLKSVDTDVKTSVLAKILVSLTIPFFMITEKDMIALTTISWQNLLHYGFLGAVSYTTISLAYYGYKELPTDLSVAVVKSYPLALLFIGLFYLGKDQPFYYYPIFITVYILMLYILRPKQHHIEMFNDMGDDKKSTKIYALTALFASMILSTTFYIFRQKGFDSHETNLIRTNIGSLFTSIASFATAGTLPDLRPEVWIKLLTFNVFVGYVIQKFHSTAVSTTPIVFYGIFMFIGAILAYYVKEMVPQLSSSENIDFRKQQ